MAGFFEMIKEMNAARSKIDKLREEFTKTIVETEVGSEAGKVRLVMDCGGGLRNIEISTELLQPEKKEMLENLINSAHADIRLKISTLVTERSKEALGTTLPDGFQF